MRRKMKLAAALLLLLAACWFVAVVCLPLPPVLPTLAGSAAPDESLFAIHPEAMTVELNHGHKTDEVFVLLHGITNTPVQFREFAEILFLRGANVLIPRMPFHGHEDRLTATWHLFRSARVPPIHTREVAQSTVFPNNPQFRRPPHCKLFWRRCFFLRQRGEQGGPTGSTIASVRFG